MKNYADNNIETYQNLIAFAQENNLKRLAGTLEEKQAKLVDVAKRMPTTSSTVWIFKAKNGSINFCAQWMGRLNAESLNQEVKERGEWIPYMTIASEVI